MAKEKKQLKQLSDEELEQVTGGTQKKIAVNKLVTDDAVKDFGVEINKDVN